MEWNPRSKENSGLLKVTGRVRWEETHRLNIVFIVNAVQNVFLQKISSSVEYDASSYGASHL